MFASWPSHVFNVCNHSFFFPSPLLAISLHLSLESTRNCPVDSVLHIFFTLLWVFFALQLIIGVESLCILQSISMRSTALAFLWQNCSSRLDVLLWFLETFILQRGFAMEQEGLWKECHHELLKLSWYLRNIGAKGYSFQESFSLHHNHKFPSSLKENNFLSSSALQWRSTSHRNSLSLMLDWIWR